MRLIAPDHNSSHLLRSHQCRSAQIPELLSHTCLHNRERHCVQIAERKLVAVGNLGVGGRHFHFARALEPQVLREPPFDARVGGPDDGFFVILAGDDLSDGADAVVRLSGDKAGVLGKADDVYFRGIEVGGGRDCGGRGEGAPVARLIEWEGREECAIGSEVGELGGVDCADVEEGNAIGAVVWISRCNCRECRCCRR